MVQSKSIDSNGRYTLPGNAAFVNLSSQSLFPAKFNKSETDLSPPKLFANKIAAEFGIQIPGLYQDYVLPRGLNAKEVEDWLLQPRIMTNAGVQVVKRPILSIFDGVKRYATIDAAPGFGESYEARTEELRELARELLELNRDTLGDIDVNILKIEHLHAFIWGCACSFNPQDVKNFAVKLEARQQTKDGLMERRELQRELEERCGIKIAWIASFNTLQRIQAAFNSNSDAVHPSIAANLKTFSLKAIEFAIARPVKKKSFGFTPSMFKTLDHE